MSTKLSLLKVDGKPGADVNIAENIFGCKFNEALIHEVVTAVMANARSDTSMQKNRSARRGGGRKPHPQKGTGRARAGSIRSPLWRGGGVTFGNQKADHSKKVNKKAYRVAIKSILSELLRQERLVLVKPFELKEAKTKVIKALLDKMGLKDVLIIVEAFNEPLYLATRNLPGIDVISTDEIDPVTLIAYEKVVVTDAALKLIEERLS